MTASQVASLLKARRTGRGKWIAKCPAHGYSHASLAISEGRTGNVVMCCMSAGCETKSILDALGLAWSDLFADEGKPRDPFWQQQQRDRESLELLERQEGLAIMAQAVYPDEREHWAEVESTCALEARELRDRLESEQGKVRKEAAEVQRIISEYGPELMECVDPHWEIDDSGPHNLPVKTWDCYRIAGKFRYVIAGDQRSIFAGGPGLHAGKRGILIYEEGKG